jgi:GNAT superfamily N-acetyltransferase
VVTFLEMRERPQEKAVEPNAGFTLVRLTAPDLGEYRRLFRLVGEDWIWVSLLELDDDAVRAILADPSVEVYALRDGTGDIGLLQLDFRVAGECELVFSGVVNDAIGKGTGRFLMNEAIARAWSRPIERFWLHTCTFDHPAAIAFYRRSGFRPMR